MPDEPPFSEYVFDRLSSVTSSEMAGSLSVSLQIVPGNIIIIYFTVTEKIKVELKETEDLKTTEREITFLFMIFI